MASSLALTVVIGLAGLLAWAPVVVDLTDEIKNYPPPHARRRQRRARRNAEAVRADIGNSCLPYRRCLGEAIADHHV